MPDPRGRTAGDHHVRVLIETPTDLPRNSRDLLAAFGATLTEANHPRLAALRKKARAFYDRKDAMAATRENET